MFKAKVLALDQTLRGPVSVDPAFAFTHQQYPPLISHVANLPALVTGVFDDKVAQSMFPWFAVALVLVLHGVLARHVGRLKAALGAAWVASLPLLSYVPYPPPGSGAASAMADIPLALFAAGAGLALVDALAARRDHAYLEVALLLGFATLTKNEGLPLVAGAALAVLLCARRARLRRVLGIAVPPLLVFALLWGSLARGFPALDEDYPSQLVWPRSWTACRACRWCSPACSTRSRTSGRGTSPGSRSSSCCCAGACGGRPARRSYSSRSRSGPT
jgi:4-amino-4-deoxy-L-arabinose transferase-like glycosyltransferase